MYIQLYIILPSGCGGGLRSLEAVGEVIWGSGTVLTDIHSAFT